MRRLRISGAAVATPRLGEAKLREALVLLGVGGYYVMVEFMKSIYGSPRSLAYGLPSRRLKRPRQ
jgi:hypothetical protein